MGTTELGQRDASALVDHERVGGPEVGLADPTVGAFKSIDAHRVVMVLPFYPRGGSAQVARYLARALGADGLDLTLCCGSLGSPGDSSHAATFFANLALEPVDFNDAMAAFQRGEDPMAAPVPLQPSFEDRPGAPDRVFASLSPDAYGRQVRAWADRLRGIATPDLYHVHHLTHVNDAVHSIGATPVAVELHGTELKMLAAIEAGAPRTWDHAEACRQRLRRAAQRAHRLVVNSPSVQKQASELLGIEPGLIDPSRLNGWLVTPDCSDELAHAIGIAVNDRALRQQRGRNGRQIIERGYDWRHIASEYEAVYAQAVSGSFRRSEMLSRGVQAENIQATPDGRIGEVHIPSGRGVAAKTKVAVTSASDR